MSIQKKSLISTLKTAKKANFAAKNEGEVKSDKQISAVKIAAPRAGISAKNLKYAKRPTLRTSFRQV
jgi:hypothetical protein